MPEKTEDAYRLTVPLSRGLVDEMEAFIEDDPQFTGKAGLARTGITQILQGNSSSGTAEVGRLEDQISDLNAAIQSLQSQMDDIQDAIVDIKIEVEGPAEEIQELTSDVFEVLPPSVDHIMEWERRKIPPDTFGEDPDPVAHSGKVVAIANILDVDEDRLRSALRQLRTDTHLVHRTEIDGELRYYKEE